MKVPRILGGFCSVRYWRPQFPWPSVPPAPSGPPLAVCLSLRGAGHGHSCKASSLLWRGGRGVANPFLEDHWGRPSLDLAQATCPVTRA